MIGTGTAILPPGTDSDTWHTKVTHVNDLCNLDPIGPHFMHQNLDLQGTIYVLRINERKHNFYLKNLFL